MSKAEDIGPAPTMGQPISVNVDEWLRGGSRRLGYPEQKLRPVEELDSDQHSQAVQAQQTFAEHLMNIQAKQQRAGKLETSSNPCGECGEVEAHYLNDYMCYKCRDSLEEGE